MKEKYKEKLPQWYTDDGKYDLILTDDIDSLLSCAILKQVKNWDIEYVMLFKTSNKDIDYMGITSNATNEAVGVDLALHKGKSFDNHVSRLLPTDPLNEECINLNMINDITRQNYFKKYNLSTVLLLWSLYKLPIPESEEGKMILLTIDSSYYSFFSGYSSFRDMNKYWLCEVMELDELYECQKRHTQAEFKEIEKKYKIGRANKIKQHKGNLYTDIDLDAINREIKLDIQCELPTSLFYLYKKFIDVQIPLSNYNRTTTKLIDIVENPYSVALTNRDFICYSQEIIESEKKK